MLEHTIKRNPFLSIAIVLTIICATILWALQVSIKHKQRSKLLNLASNSHFHSIESEFRGIPQKLNFVAPTLHTSQELAASADASVLTALQRLAPYIKHIKRIDQHFEAGHFRVLNNQVVYRGPVTTLASIPTTIEATINLSELVEHSLAQKAYALGLDIDITLFDTQSNMQLNYFHLSRTPQEKRQASELRWQKSKNLTGLQLRAKTVPVSNLFLENEAFDIYLPVALTFLIGIISCVFIVKRQRARDLLKAQIDYKVEVYNAQPAPSFVLNEELKFLDCNHAFEELTGTAKSNIIGRGPEATDLLDDDSLKRLTAIDKIALKTNDQSSDEIQVVDGHGVKRQGIYNRRGITINNTHYLIGTFIDISAQKLLEKNLLQSLTRFEVLLDSLPDPTLLIDQNGKTIYVNINAQELMRQLDPTQTKHTFEDLLPENITIADVIKKTHKLTLTNANNQFIPIEVTSNTVEEISGLVHIISIRDISERVETERKLLEAKKISDDANQIKSEFISNISHELKTPINTISGYTDLIQESERLEDVQKYQQKIRSSAQKLISLVNDLLDFSDIETGAFDFNTYEFDIQRLMEELIQGFQSESFPSQKQTFNYTSHLPSNALIFSSPTSIHVIVSNFLSNAFKFTPEGEISLTVRCIGSLANIQDYETLSIEVEDTGIGIGSSKLQSIFEPFSQADGSKSRSFEGTGIGLATCKQIATALNADIQVISTEGLGSTFSLQIPVRIIIPEGETTSGRSPAEDQTKLENAVVEHVTILSTDFPYLGLWQDYLSPRGVGISICAPEDTPVYRQRTQLYFIDLDSCDATEAEHIVKQHMQKNGHAKIATLSTAHAVPALSKLPANQVNPRDGVYSACLYGTDAVNPRDGAYSARLYGTEVVNPVNLAEVAKLCGLHDQPLASDNEPAAIVHESEALSRLGGNTKLYCQLLRDFLESQMDKIRMFNPTISNKPPLSELNPIAHSLKGLAMNIGANPLSELLLAIENSSRNEQAIDKQIWAQLCTAREKTEIEIKRILEENVEAAEIKPANISKETLNELLVTASKLLADNDTEAIDYLEQAVRHSTNAALDDILDMAKNYLFDDALQSLNNLIEPGPEE